MCPLGTKDVDGRPQNLPNSHIMKLFVRYNDEGENFLKSIVTRDEKRGFNMTHWKQNDNPNNGCIQIHQTN